MRKLLFTVRRQRVVDEPIALGMNSSRNRRTALLDFFWMPTKEICRQIRTLTFAGTCCVILQKLGRYMRKNVLIHSFLFLFQICVCASYVHAEQAAANPVPPSTPLLGRLSMETVELSSRYVYADLRAGAVTDREMEYRMTHVVRVRLDDASRFYLQARGQSGSAFQGSWDEAGVGLTNGHLSYNVKSLFLAAQMPHAIALEAGGIEFERGAGSEITYAANEGWLTGYRMKVGCHCAIANRIVATFGYVGDFSKPNFFSRIDRMRDFNYAQVIAELPLAGREKGSVEAGSIAGIRYLRAALDTRRVPSRFVSEVRAESVARVGAGATAGWGLTASRNIANRGSVDLRFSSMPVTLFEKAGNQVLINGGEVGLGRRGALITNWRLGNGIVLETLTARRLDDATDTPRWRTFISLHYELSKPLNSLVNR